MEKLYRRQILAASSLFAKAWFAPCNSSAAETRLLLELVDKFRSDGLAVTSILNESWVARIPGSDRSIQGRLSTFVSAARIVANGTHVVGVSPGAIILFALDGRIVSKCPLKMVVSDVSLSPKHSKALIVEGARASGCLLVSRLWGDAKGCQLSVEELSLDGRSCDLADPGLSWSPDERYFVYSSSGRIYTYDVERHVSQLLCEGMNPRWAPDGKWVTFRSVDGQACLVEPMHGELRKLMENRRIRGALHWSPDSQYVFFSELETDFISHPGMAVRFVVYRLRDGATEPLFRTAGAIYDHFFDWAIIPPQLRSQ